MPRGRCHFFHFVHLFTSRFGSSVRKRRDWPIGTFPTSSRARLRRMAFVTSVGWVSWPPIFYTEDRPEIWGKAVAENVSRPIRRFRIPMGWTSATGRW